MTIELGMSTFGETTDLEKNIVSHADWIDNISEEMDWVIWKSQWS